MQVARHLLQLLQGRGRGNSNENNLSIQPRRPSKIQKAEEGHEYPFIRQPCRALSGAAAAQGPHFRGRIKALCAMIGSRHTPARSAALAASVMGWVWVLYEGVGWALGV